MPAPSQNNLLTRGRTRRLISPEALPLRIVHARGRPTDEKPTMMTGLPEIFNDVRQP